MSSTSPLAATAGFSHPDRPPMPRRPRYPSDLTDRQWTRVAALLPAGPPRRKHHPRDILDALQYRWMTGCSWRMLPHDFPAWETVYTYQRQWQRAGVLSAIRAALLERRRDRMSSGLEQLLG
jgi:putative transposase